MENMRGVNCVYNSLASSAEKNGFLYVGKINTASHLRNPAGDIFHNLRGFRTFLKHLDRHSEISAPYILYEALVLFGVFKFIGMRQCISVDLSYPGG